MANPQDKKKQPQGLLSGLVNRVIQYFNPTSGYNPKTTKVENFYTSPVGRTLAGAQKFVEGPQRTRILSTLQDRLFPQFKQNQNDSTPVKIAKSVVNIPANIGDTVVGKGIIDPALDVGKIIAKTVKGEDVKYKDLKSGPTKIGYQIASTLNPTRGKELGTKKNFTEVVANVADTVEPMLYAKGGKVAVKTAGGKELLKQGTKQLIIKGAKEGAKIGAQFGAVTGAQEGRDDSIKDQVIKMVMDSVLGAGGGAVVGAGTAGVSSLVRQGLSGGSKVVQPQKEPSTMRFKDPEIQKVVEKVTQKTTKVKEPIIEPVKLAEKVDDYIPEKGQKMRGFPETVVETPGTPEPVATATKLRPESYYTPLTNKETVAKATALINKSEQEALKLARVGQDTDANATAMLLIDKYLKADRFEEANALIKEVSPRFTSQGQQIQILSLYGRLTPSGAIKYAQRVVDEANAANPKLKLSLTPETLEKISNAAEKIQATPEGSRERAVATQLMLKEIAAQVPASLGQKLATIQTMAQLLNPKTAIRNVLGNTVFGGLENVSQTVGAGIDKAVSTVTGRRSLTVPDLGVQAKGFKRGLMEGIDDAMQGIDTSGRATKYDLPTRTFHKGILSKLETALNVELRATDRAAATAAYDEALVSQMKAAGVTKPTEGMMARAETEALYKTFQDNSFIATMLSETKNRVMNRGKDFGLGDLILKYPKTPGNLVARGVDYSPFGFIKTVYNLVNPAVGVGADVQRDFVQNLSRSLVGTGLMTTGFIFAKLGLIKGSPEADKDIGAVQRAQGQGPFTFNISGAIRYFQSGFKPEAAQPKSGDIITNYDWLQPNAIQLSMGANMALGGKGKDLATSTLNTFIEGLESGVDTLVEQPVVQGYRRFVQTAGDKNRGGLTRALADAAANAPASFVPSLLNQVGQLTDNTSRDTYDPNVLTQGVNMVKARVPGLRESLPARVDVFGNYQTMYKLGGNNLINVFLNPAFLSRYVESPAADLVMDIFNNSGETQQAPKVVDRKITVNGERIALSPQQVQVYQLLMGARTKQAFESFASDPGFMSLPDEQKAKVMGNMIADINNQVKLEVFSIYKGKQLPPGTAGGGITLKNAGSAGLSAQSGKSYRVKRASVKGGKKTAKLILKKGSKVAKAKRIKIDFGKKKREENLASQPKQIRIVSRLNTTA